MLAGLGGDEAVHTVDNDAQLRIIAVWTSPGAAAYPPRTARLGGRDLWSYRLRRLHTHRFDEGLRSSREDDCHAREKTTTSLKKVNLGYKSLSIVFADRQTGFLAGFFQFSGNVCLWV